MAGLDPDHHGWHTESVVLRLLLLGVLGYQVVTGHVNGAVVAGIGLVLTLVPAGISHFSGWHVPRVLELTYVLGIALQFVSESFKLFELFTYWDKLVHPAEIFLASGVATFLLLGYRELHELEVPDGLAATGAMLFGISLGATWELVEFAFDWFGNTNLQKSNADTMTDVLTNNAGAIFGTLAAFWVFRHRLDAPQHMRFGQIAEWLTSWMVVVFSRHGLAAGIVVALLVAGMVLAGWLVDRPPFVSPAAYAEPVGPAGSGGSWQFVRARGLPPEVQPVAGDWRVGERGACQTRPEGVVPGSEEPAVLLLQPDAVYGAQRGFAVETEYGLDRPAIGSGTAMNAGILFGWRDPDTYYLLRASATTDAVDLTRYIGGRPRELREERLRTHGGEWHRLRLEVQGDQVRVLADGKLVFQETASEALDGHLGLWTRVSATGCFTFASVQPLRPATS